MKEKKQRTKKAFTPEEARKFYAAALEDRWALPLPFMLLTGVRIGEAVALIWDDVNIEKDDLKAVYVLVNKTRSEHQGHVYENSHNTAAANRKVYLSEDAQELMKQVKERAILEAEGHGNGVGRFLFPSPRSGQPMKHDTLRGVMERICQVAGIPRLTPHGLRHSFTSLMHAQGGTLTSISAHLGHAQISTTLNIYRTVFDSERRGVTLNLSGQAEEKEVGAGKKTGSLDDEQRNGQSKWLN